ncbi:MAG: hypothetical protein NT080_11805 [Spirochaetes bacterium]|nr:hypothetical protein [Spirochaetota bacterium]
MRVAGFHALAAAAILFGAAAPAPAFAEGASLYVSPKAFFEPSADGLTFSGVSAGIAADGILGDNGYAFVSAETDVDLSDPALPTGSIELKEAYAELTVGELDLSFGRRILAWGLADGFNPTDNVNARRIGTRTTSTLDERKIPALMLRASYALPGSLGSVEALVMPLPGTNDLPLTVSSATILAGPATILNNFLAEEIPEFSWDGMEYGARAMFYFGGFSCSASWLHAWDRYPDIRYSTTTTGSPPGTTTTNEYTPVHRRVQVFGADAQASLAGFDLRAEGAFFLTGDTDGSDIFTKNHSLQAVAQASRQLFSPWLTIGLGWSPAWVVAWKAPADWTTDEDRANAEEMRKRNGQGYAFENGVSLSLRGNSSDERVSWDAMGLYNVAARDCMTRASVSWSLADGINLKVGGSLYGTAIPDDPDREYGVFGNEAADAGDELFVELRFDF